MLGSYYELRYKLCIYFDYRLVYGTAPKGLKQPFIPELRLLGCVEVDRVFALPLQKDTDLVAVPLNAKLKLHRAKNMEQLENFIEYLRFLEKAQRLLAEARDRLQIVDIKLSDKEKKESKSSSRHLPNVISALDNGYVLRKSMSCDSHRYIQQKELTPIVDEYSEIDQIYDYVRGLAPLPKNLNRTDGTTTHTDLGVSNKHAAATDKSQPDSGNYSLIRNNNSLNSSSGKHSNYAHHHHSQNYTGGHTHHHQSNNNNDDDKPIPPPIETIPGKKLPEKRQRPTLPKLYVKNMGSSVNSPHQKLTIGNSPAIIINAKDGLEPQSPLFHIR